MHRSTDDKVANRNKGIAREGMRARGCTNTFHKGDRYSAMSGYTVKHAFLEPFIVQGTFNGKRFLTGLRRCVLPYMRPYPEPCSVLLLDNCRIHSALPEIIEAVYGIGARCEWLMPYDPQHMPIEIGFRAYKDERRIRREFYQSFGSHAFCARPCVLRS